MLKKFEQSESRELNLNMTKLDGNQNEQKLCKGIFYGADKYKIAQRSLKVRPIIIEML